MDLYYHTARNCSNPWNRSVTLASAFCIRAITASLEVKYCKLVGLFVWLALRGMVQAIILGCLLGRKGIQGNIGKGKRGGWRRRLWDGNRIVGKWDRREGRKFPFSGVALAALGVWVMTNVGYKFIYERAGVDELKTVISCYILYMLNVSLSQWDFSVFLQYCGYLTQPGRNDSR